MSAHPPTSVTGNRRKVSNDSGGSGANGAGTNGSGVDTGIGGRHEAPGGQSGNDGDYYYDEEENEDYSSDEYDPHEELANYYDRKLEIEESWLEWEQSQAIKNRNYDQRRRLLEEQLASSSYRGFSNNGPAGSSLTRRGSGQTAAEAAAIERLRELGSTRPSAAIIESYTALSWEEKRRVRRERLASKHVENGTGENLICLMPIEILTDILSYLEPRELFNASLVDPLFYHIVNTDACWKMAFDKFFGTRAPFNRLDTRSWRAEYFRRTNLLRKWSRGRGQNPEYDVMADTVKQLWVAEDGPGEGWILAGSLESGAVIRCDPQRSKVYRDYIYPNRNQIRTITAMDIDRHHVFWGSSGGEVAMTRLTKNATDSMFRSLPGLHTQQVTCIKLLPSDIGIALSGDSAGVIKAWDTRKNQCVKIFVARPPPTALEIHESITSIQCNPKSHIIAGTESGRLYVWEFDLTALVSTVILSTPSSGTSTTISSPSHSATHIQQLLQASNETDGPESPPQAHTVSPKLIDLPLRGKRIRYLETHFENDDGMIIVGQEDATTIQIYSTYRLELVGILQSPAHYSAITACAWDPPRAPEKPMVPSAPSKMSHEAGLFVTGDAVGNICTWTLPWELATHPPGFAGTWAGHSPRNAEEALWLRPSCVLKGHDDEISSLFIDRVLVVSGCLQGKVKVWNPLNGELVRLIRSTRMSLPSAAKTVTCIKVNSEKCRGVVSIGRMIVSWDYSGGIAAQAKGKQRKGLPKRASHSSSGQRRKVQSDIKQSLQETISLKRLEEQARARREQLHRRYNQFDKREAESSAADMTEEELLEYVMMLSRDHQITDEREIARQMAKIHAMGGATTSSGSGSGSKRSPTFNMMGWSSLTEPTESVGTGSSKDAPSVAVSEVSPPRSLSPKGGEGTMDDDEEEELVRRAIELSMADMGEQSSSMHNDEVVRFLNTVSPSEEGHDALIDVDSLPAVAEMAEEDQAIVREILKELKQEELGRQAQDSTTQSREEWPTLSSNGTATTSIATSTAAITPSIPLATTTPTVGEDKEDLVVQSGSAMEGENSVSGSSASDTPGLVKKSWSMVAKATLPPTSTSSSTLRAIQVAMEEDEDEDAQLARILSLSMVEK